MSNYISSKYLSNIWLQIAAWMTVSNSRSDTEISDSEMICEILCHDEFCVSFISQFYVQCVICLFRFTLFGTTFYYQLASWLAQILSTKKI